MNPISLTLILAFSAIPCTSSTSVEFHEVVPQNFREAAEDLEVEILNSKILNYSGYYSYYGSVITGIITEDSDIDVEVIDVHTLRSIHYYIFYTSTEFQVLDGNQIERKLSLLKIQHNRTGVMIDVKAQSEDQKDCSRDVRDYIAKNQGLRECLCEIKRLTKHYLPKNEYGQPVIHAFAMNLLGIWFWQTQTFTSYKMTMLHHWCRWLRYDILAEPKSIVANIDEHNITFKFDHCQTYNFERTDSNTDMFRLVHVHKDYILSAIDHFLKCTYMIIVDPQLYQMFLNQPAVSRPQMYLQNVMQQMLQQHMQQLQYEDRMRKQPNQISEDSPYTMVFKPERKILTTSDDKTVKLWDVESGDSVKTFEEHGRSVRSAFFSPDSTKVLTASDNTAKLWDIKSGDCVKTFEGHRFEVLSAVFSPDSTQVLTASRDKTAKLWNVESGDCVKTFKGHEDGVRSAVFSPNSTQVLTTSIDKTFKLWNVESGKCVKTFEYNRIHMHSAVFSPDSTQVLTASGDKTAKLWNVESGKCVKTFQRHDGLVNSAVFSPDSTQVLTASNDKTVKLWDIKSGNCVKTFEGHGRSVSSAVFSPDSTQVLTASYDTTVKLWDVESGDCVKTFEGHRNFVNSAVFSP